MNANGIRHLAAWTLAVIGMSVITSGVVAGSFTRGCAARDLQVLMIIEDRENTGVVSTEKLSDVMVELMNARIVCHEGRVLEALALYDAIAEQMLPVVSGRAQANEIR